jgi:hypothetical protein
MATVIIECESVNPAEHVIERNVFVKAEIIKQPHRRSLKAHHRRLSRKSAGFNESRHSSARNQAATFSTSGNGAEALLRRPLRLA